MNGVRLESITKIYKSSDIETRALKGVSLSIEQGEFVALAGPSGSGKTTLANIVGCLDKLDEGTYYFNSKNVATLSDSERTLFRREQIGFVFQSYNLIPVLTALENVSISCELKGVQRTNSLNLAKEMLQKVGLEEHMDKFPRQLSGGQQQRVTIARALVKKPTLILADEPSAHLDSENTVEILALLQTLNKTMNVTCIVCTHDERILRIAPRIIQLVDGKIASDKKRTSSHD